MREEPGGNPEVPALSLLYLNPAPGCNLHCAHCWVNEGHAVSSMPGPLWLSLMDEAQLLGVDTVKFTGGEPLLHPDFTGLYRAARNRFSRVLLETNGTLTPPGIFPLFRQSPPDDVALSLDSRDPAVHDAFRGVPGAWNLTVAFLRNLVEHAGLRPQIIMSLQHPRKEPVEEMVRFLEGSGVSSLKLNLISSAGKGASLRFGAGDSMTECIRFLEWAFRELPPWVVPDAPAAFLPVPRLKEGCSCAIPNLLAVLPDGTLSFCGIAYSLPALALGKYPRDRLAQVWKGAPLLAELRRSLEGNPEGVCGRCIHWRSCLGKCVMENYAAGGAFSSPHPFCDSAYREGLFPATRLHG